MAFRQGLKPFTALAVIATAMGLATTACVPAWDNLPGSPPTSAPAQATPADKWSALLQITPYPHYAPLPPPTPTFLDGTYTKFEFTEATPVHCLRCPDYAPEGGLWKMNLDQGIFRIFYEFTGWRSIASFTLSGDQLTLFNDPNCPQVVGTYTWKLEEGKLALQVIEDECAIGLRAMNLTNLPWLSCRPPNSEAAITDHWPKPPGCE